MATSASSDNTDRNPAAAPTYPQCKACEVYSAAGATVDPTPTAPGRLIWICPICGRAWPRYATGDRGRLAFSLSGRLNHPSTITIARKLPPPRIERHGAGQPAALLQNEPVESSRPCR